ncbi:MAG: hypothetical protein ABWY05_15605 [Noviherbaspirillum sp.]
MSTIAKHKSPQVPLQSSAQLFSELGEMFLKPDKGFSAQKVSASLNKSLRQLQDHVSPAELVTLRNVVRELASQVDRLVPINDSSAVSSASDFDELERARREDALGEKVLDAAGRRGPIVMSTPKSIRQGNEAMARAEKNAAATTAQRIANHELISSGELQLALGVKRQALSSAVKARRLFAIVGPSGENYYPAYYADPTLDRRTLEQVSKALGSLPAPSKHHFFTSKSTMLQETPLDALRKGREAEVLAAAAGFAER